MAQHWQNWSGRLTAKPAALTFVRSEADAQATVADAARRGLRIRVAGATHSHAPLVQHDDVIVDCHGLAGVAEVDQTTRRAWLWAGSRLFTLGRELHQHGLALANQGDIDQQAVAGVTGTGTHGTGVSLKNLSAAVTGIRLIQPDGAIVVATADENASLWQASRLHLGAFGLVTQVQLQLRGAYRLEEHGWQAPLDEVLEQIDTLTAENRHFEFFWYPQGDTANAKRINETSAEPVYPLTEEGTRCAWSYEVLPNHRPHKHTEMEYSVPAEHGPACMRAIQQLLREDFPDVVWPVEYRTLAADDVWLSTAYERPTVTISVHQDVRIDERAYYEACEEIFRAHDGRPHWGKVHYLSGETLAAIHPRWSDWWEARNASDPQGVFLNDYLQGFQPS